MSLIRAAASCGFFARRHPAITVLLLWGASWLVSFKFLGDARLGADNVAWVDSNGDDRHGHHPAATLFVVLAFLSACAVGACLKVPRGPQPPSIYDDPNVS